MKRYLLGAALAAFAFPAWAQTQTDFYIEESGDCCEPDQIVVGGFPLFGSAREIVVTATRVGYADRDDITAPATIITEDQIEARAQANLADILRSVPGLAVSSSGSANGLTQLRLRGAEANQIVVLIDGVEVSNPADGAFDFASLRADTIVRVEVLRGEQSALYGSDAVAGVINIVTTSGSVHDGWAATLEAGSRNSFEGSVGAGIPLGKGEIALLSVNGNVFRTDGFDVSGTTGDADGAQGRSIRIGLNQFNLGNLRLEGMYSFSTRDSEFDSDTDFDGRLNDTDDELTIDVETARILGIHRLGDWTTNISLSRAKTETDTRSGFPTFTTGTRDQATLATERRWDKQNVTALVEYEREEYAFRGDPDSPSNDLWGIAGNYRYEGDALTLSASARYDDNALFDDSLTWRFGAGYDTGAFGRFTAGVGTGVNNPTLIELFGFFPASTFTGNPDLQPEESLGFDIGWSKRVNYHGRIAVNYFRSELSDEIITIFNPDFTTSVANLTTDSTREGVEIEVYYDFTTVKLSGSVSFLDSDQDGVEEIRRPDFLASASATWEPTDELSLTVFADHTGSQLDTDFATFSNIELDAFTLVGASATFEAADDIYLTLRGENLLDEDYQELVGYRSPGAAVFVGLRADFR